MFPLQLMTAKLGGSIVSLEIEITISVRRTESTTGFPHSPVWDRLLLPCMHVCIHACMYVCMHICMYVRMYVWSNLSDSFAVYKTISKVNYELLGTYHSVKNKSGRGRQYVKDMLKTMQPFCYISLREILYFPWLRHQVEEPFVSSLFRKTLAKWGEQNCPSFETAESWFENRSPWPTVRRTAAGPPRATLHKTTTT